MSDDDGFSPHKNYGIYIHIPFCKAKCAYCSFVSISDASRQQRYIEALLSEIAASESCGAAADTVYIGGGTPSCLFRGAITRILSDIRRAFRLSDGAEITVEANPESCDEAFAEECMNAGVNRISMGLQSANDAVLAKIGRLHTACGFEKAAALLEKTGFRNISSDLILGLPDQDISDVSRAVDIMSRYCKHASVYALTVERGTPLESSHYAPDDDFVADLYDFAVARLAQNGFMRYEVSNFAHFGCESRHNSKYWTGEPYIGFGVAAHSYDGRCLRRRHTDDITEYIETGSSTDEILSEKDRYNEYVMLRLRTEIGLDRKAFFDAFGYDFCEKHAEAINNYVKIGAIIVDGERVRIAPDKMFVMNGIIENFMDD